MALEVQIPQEIREYQEKIMFGMSVRQLICMSIGVVIGGSTYFLTKPLIGEDWAGYLVVFEVMPLFALGFIKIKGFPFEKFAKIVLQHKFGLHKRVYSTARSITPIPMNKIGSDKNGEFSKEYFTVTEESRKRKSQELCRKFKAAEQEYRNAKQGIHPEEAEGSGSENDPADH